MAILISGIGRSGTTLIFRLIGKGVLSQYIDAKCVYEPYLWDMPEVEKTAETVGQPFSVGQLGLFNMSVHCHTPLFLDGRHGLHDGWLNRIFCVGSSIPSSAPEGVLVKVIRGAGRVEAALSKIENLKVIVVVRNVVDTVNSSLGLFSFFGDEFHKSDKSRFLMEINARFDADLNPHKKRNELEWAVLWWKYFTEESFRIALRYPGRVFLCPYEAFLNDKMNYSNKLFEFLGLNFQGIDESLLEKPAGPRTSVTYLSIQDIDSLKDHVSRYCNLLENYPDAMVEFKTLWNTIYKKYSHRAYVKSILMEGGSDRTSTSWRSEVQVLRDSLAKNSVKKISEKSERKNFEPLTSSFAFSNIGRDKLLGVAKSKTNQNLFGEGKKRGAVGVVITCFNNSQTIKEAVSSVLAQSRKAEIIMICDDASKDGSQKIIETIAKNNDSVIPVYREENIGVAANRDLAIRQLPTDYVTTLDGDDIYSPLKLEFESSALDNSKEAVAFSNYILIGSCKNTISDTSKYHKSTVDDGLMRIASLSDPVPRDMMLRKSVFELAEGFDVRMSIYEDWSLKMRLLNAAGDGGWCHSGVIGTLYDRRRNGLSGKDQVFHAHGRLLALSRNAHLFINRTDALKAGFQTITIHLSGDLKDSFKAIYNRPFDKRLFKYLDDFWRESTIKDDIELVMKDLNEFVKRMG